MRRFEGQTVLVTGASRGIGAAAALAFAAEGARVAVNYRADEPGATQVVETIRAEGATAEPFRADVARRADVEALAGDVEARLGRVAVLVNNAAIIDRSGFFDIDLERFEEVWHANVRGVYQLSRIVGASMVAGRGGAIVHISSILARLAVPNRTAYITSKAAIEGLTRAMALELAPHGVRVNAVAPGLIATEALLAGMPDKGVQAEVQRHIPGGRFGRPDEIAAAILWVASSEASYLNGSVITVDAGLGGREAGPSPW
ncbi:MAG: SDR family NAD(P)-dependent oxidoreductase [Acidimicrobiales bacterium]